LVLQIHFIGRTSWNNKLSALIGCRSPVPFPEKNGEIYIAISSRARRIIALFVNRRTRKGGAGGKHGPMHTS
jgi:hypothetical protein